MLVAMVANVGALAGGILFGTWSEKIGRRRAIVIAALLAIPVIPLWAYSRTVPMLALGGFLMQFMVQGAWGVIPAHLNELVAAGGAGNVPGIRLPAGEFPFFEEFGAAGEAGGTALWRQLSAGAGVDGAAGGQPGGDGHLERKGTARGGPVEHELAERIDILGVCKIWHTAATWHEGSIVSGEIPVLG